LGRVLRIFLFQAVVLGLLAISKVGLARALNKHELAQRSDPRAVPNGFMLPRANLSANSEGLSPAPGVPYAEAGHALARAKLADRRSPGSIFLTAPPRAVPSSLRRRSRQSPRLKASQDARSCIPMLPAAAEQRLIPVFVPAPLGIPWSTGPPPGRVLAHSSSRLPGTFRSSPISKFIRA